jgi:hypothetical protein
MRNRLNLLAGAAALVTFALANAAYATPDGVKMGLLTCHVNSGWGYVLGSSKDVHCNYHPNHGQDDFYDGSVSKFGVDIGYTGDGVIIWDVVALTSDVRIGALAGDYAGATASATVAVGLGANVLLGGFDKSIALQPVSVEGNTGLDIAAGIGALSLRRAEPPVPPHVAALPEKAFAVYFNFNQATLTAEGRAVVARAVREAEREGTTRIFVTGHADRVGTESYNKGLSLGRASAVKAQMVRDGLNDAEIYIAGRGFNDPIELHRMAASPASHSSEEAGIF